VTSDALRGMPAITAAYNQITGHELTERQVHHLAVTGALPVWKCGGRLESSRSILKRCHEERQAEALARALGRGKEAA
jgi:hypothetical protein